MKIKVVKISERTVNISTRTLNRYVSIKKIILIYAIKLEKIGHLCRRISKEMVTYYIAILYRTFFSNLVSKTTTSLGY